AGVTVAPGGPALADLAVVHGDVVVEGGAIAQVDVEDVAKDGARVDRGGVQVVAVEGGGGGVDAQVGEGDLAKRGAGGSEDRGGGKNLLGVHLFSCRSIQELRTRVADTAPATTEPQTTGIHLGMPGSASA